MIQKMAVVSNLFIHKSGIRNTGKEAVVTMALSKEDILYIDVIKQHFFGENTLIKRITIQFDEIEGIDYYSFKKDKITKNDINQFKIGYMSKEYGIFNIISLIDYTGKGTANKNFINELTSRYNDFKKRKKSHTEQTVASIKSPSTPSKPLTVETSSLSLNTITACKKFKDYVVLDLETTGLDRQGDKIIEIAMIKFKDNEVSFSTETLINPGIHIPESASRVNHIYDEDVKNAPKIEDVIEAVNEFIEDLPIVAHNASFDVSFLAREMSNAGISRKLEYVDTISLCRKVLNLKSNSLDAVSKHLQLSREETHRAMSDSVATAEILQYCLNKQISEHEERQARKKEEKARMEEWRHKSYAASPLLDVGIAFTGEFSVSREDMEKAAKKVGALVKTSISRKVNYLVLGDISNYINGSKKFEDANTYQKNGHNIKIISEIEFFGIVESAKNKILENIEQI